jgi:hypothetical protein
MPSANGTFELSGWDEQPVAEWDGGKVTRASVTQTVTGDVTGAATTEWLMCYAADGTARYVGLQRVEGALAGREGSFVLESSGEFADGVARGSLRVVPGSGTGGLAGLTGEGKLEAPHGPTATFGLDYDLG